MTKTLQHLLLCNVTEKNYKICRRRPEHAFDIHLPLGFLVYRVSSNFIQEYLSFSKQFSNWVCTLMTMLQPGSFPIRLNLSHQYILVVLYGLIVKSCPTLCDTMDNSPMDYILCPWDSPGKNTGKGCHFLLQGTFPTQELNPGLLHCRQILYQLSYEGTHPNTSQNVPILFFLLCNS